MQRSITRGLAVGAVSALAVTGLSLAVTPAAGAAGPEVELLTQFTGFAALVSDGSGSGSRLTAVLEDPDAEVTFQVNADPEAADADPGWRDVGAPTEVSGRYAFADWSGEDGQYRSYAGERVALRAVATGAGGTSYSTRNDVEVTGDRSVESVSISTSSARYFAQPYVGSDRTSSTIEVSGVTSASSGTVELSSWRDGDGVPAGRTAAEVELVPSKIPGSTQFEDTGRFQGFLEIAPFEVRDGVVAVAAERGSDDVAPISLVPQTVTTVNAYGSNDTRPGEQGDVDVVVTDQDGVGIRGAEVRRLADGSLVGYTDGSGVVATTQLGDTAVEYYANATDQDGFAAEDGDVASGPITVPTYQPEASYVDVLLGDGSVFDVDEYAVGDLVVVARDDRGRPVAGENVSYRIYPSDEDAPVTYAAAVTDADGVAVAEFEAAGASGSYTFAAALTSQLGVQEDRQQTFSTGQAALLLSPRADTVEAAPGGQVDYFGRLVVDGEPLAGRRVDLAYERGVEVVPGNRPDATLLAADGSPIGSLVTTNDNGSFRVTVDDQAETPQASEVGGVLTATTGDTVATGESTVDGDAGASTTSTTRFGSGERGTAEITLGGAGNGARADRLRVAGPATLAGEDVKVFRVAAGGRRVLVTTRTLDRNGDRAVRVADANGAARTTYVVRLVASARVLATDSGTRSVR